MMKPAGRIVFRVEGINWNCYFAVLDTMEGAIFIGSIPMRFVANPTRKSQFMALMRDCFSDVMEQLTGERPKWPEPEGVAAPDHERSGTA